MEVLEMLSPAFHTYRRSPIILNCVDSLCLLTVDRCYATLIAFSYISPLQLPRRYATIALIYDDFIYDDDRLSIQYVKSIMPRVSIYDYLLLGFDDATTKIPMYTFHFHYDFSHFTRYILILLNF